MFARSSLSSSCSSSLGSHPSFTTHAHRCVSSLGSSSILYTKSRSSAKYAGFNGTPVQTNQNNSSGRSRSRVFFSASAAAPPPLPTIDMAFQEFPAVRRAGGLDTPLIILHGMLGSSSNWRSIAQNPNVRTCICMNRCCWLVCSHANCVFFSFMVSRLFIFTALGADD